MKAQWEGKTFCDLTATESRSPVASAAVFPKTLFLLLKSLCVLLLQLITWGLCLDCV